MEKKPARLVQELKPDILIMDIMMDGLDGIDATRTVVKNGFYNVIMLSIHAARCYVSEAVQAGVKAYVLKQSSFADLIKAIDLVAAGKRYFSSSVAEMAESCEQEAEINALTPFTHLTSRERRILFPGSGIHKLRNRPAAFYQPEDCRNSPQPDNAQARIASHGGTGFLRITAGNKPRLDCFQSFGSFDYGTGLQSRKGKRDTERFQQGTTGITEKLTDPSAKTYKAETCSSYKS